MNEHRSNPLREVTNEYQRHHDRYKQAMSRGDDTRADDALSEMREMEKNVVVIDQRQKDKPLPKPQQPRRR